MNPDQIKTLVDLFHARAAESAARPAMRLKRDGQWQDILWSEVAKAYYETAAGLAALGVAPGDRVAILSENRPEWAFADMGTLSAAAIDVPIYATNLDSQVEYILQNSGSVGCFVSSAAQLAKVQKSWPNCPDLRFVVAFDAPPADKKTEKVLTFAELRAKGAEKLRAEPKLLEERRKAVKADDPASFIYTSGTTGDPKGVVLTHRNFVSNALTVVGLIRCTPEDIFLSFLPLSHSFERMGGYYAVLAGGGVIAYAESVDKVRDNLPEVRPTIMCSVPRLYEKIYAGLRELVLKGSPLKQKMFAWATDVGRACSAARQRGEEPGFFLAIQRAIADRLVYSKVRERFGGRLRFFVSGGAALSREIAEFFDAIGIVILEGYGLTETSPVITCNTPDARRIGTVGKPIPGVEVKINPEPDYPPGEGEIWARGPNIMKGYYKREQETKEVLTEDGWFKTGDIGRFDDQGFVKITDRKKDLLKTSGGKYIAPQQIENDFKTDRLIGECVVIAENRNYPSMLIVPKFEVLEQWAREKGIAFKDRADLIANAEVKKALDAAVAEKNKHLAQYEKIKKYRLLDREFSQETGELTPTMKVKRKVVNQKYKAQIDEMYAEAKEAAAASA
jgi:long-chain acyl-CoA synthetase